MPMLREAEQRAAAAAVGVKDVEFLDGYADGTLDRRSSCAATSPGSIRQVRPDRILTNSPLRRWERISGPRHPDHLAVGEATTCAVYPDARNEFAFPELLRDEGLEPWIVREIWYHGRPEPGPLRRHHRRVPAQARGSAGARDADHPHGPRRPAAHDARRPRAKAAGLPEGRLAEGVQHHRRLPVERDGA